MLHLPPQCPQPSLVCSDACPQGKEENQAPTLQRGRRGQQGEVGSWEGGEVGSTPLVKEGQDHRWSGQSWWEQ